MHWNIIGSQFIDIDAAFYVYVLYIECIPLNKFCNIFHILCSKCEIFSIFLCFIVLFASFLPRSNEIVLFLLVCPLLHRFNVRFQFHFDSSVILLSMNLSSSCYTTFCDCNTRPRAYARVKSFYT